jgi:cellulose biosynthesis protein BcsQ
MPIIAVAAAKGGTGKTTAALSLAAALAEISADDVSTVLIDLDPCGDATQRMGVARESASLGALLSGRRNAADRIGDFTVLDAAHQTGERFAVVPSCDDIGEVEAHFAEMPGGLELLTYRLHALGRDCRLVVDTAPGITTFLGRAAIVAADVVIVPIVPQPGACRRAIEVLNLLRGMGGAAHVFVVAAQVNGTGRDVDALNDGLRNDRLAVSEWFPYESSVARSAWSTGTALFLAPASQCAESYRNLARNIQETIAQRKSLALLPPVRQHP